MAVRTHLKPFAVPNAPELAEEDYALLRESANRRAVPAALALALSEHLTPDELYGLYRPFQLTLPLQSLGARIGTRSEPRGTP
jgi:hypothetical protein